MWRDYLEKSTINLLAAERDFEHGSYDPCASRAYFSAFQAALAALLALTDYQKRGRFWDHGNIAAQFAQRLIRRRKVLARSQAGILDDLRLFRHQADYDAVRTSRSRARQSLNKAKPFVARIEAVLKREQAT